METFENFQNDCVVVVVVAAAAAAAVVVVVVVVVVRLFGFIWYVTVCQ